MRLRDLVLLILALELVGTGAALQAADKAPEKPEKMVGLYVHQHWPYNHPYAARTWTVEDWRGYAGALRQLGFNTIMIWPMLETMPEPLAASDRASLEKIGKVIDCLHNELGMKIYITLCPNIVADSAAAGQAAFERRHFFHSDLRVNPADAEAMRRMISFREQLFRPLAKADGVSIIDSDPGGYPGSNNREFVQLLVEHRKMFDRLRPGIELLYWMHAGWPAYCRFYETAELGWSKPEEFEEALRLLKEANPEPWGVANNLDIAKKVAIDSRVILFRYGAIEGEPSFPLTNFGGDAAYQAGAGAGPRGVMGNAQTHCVQLPNTFAFARGAQGKPVTMTDYIDFANQLLPGHGPTIVAGWKALNGSDSAEMRLLADRLSSLNPKKLSPGPLRGLLFGDPERFVTDLVMQLRAKAALEDFCSASEKGQDVRPTFGKFIENIEPWQKRHGYENSWGWPRMNSALARLNSPEIMAILNPRYEANTPYGRSHEMLYRAETSTPRLIDAMKATLARMEKKG